MYRHILYVYYILCIYLIYIYIYDRYLITHQAVVRFVASSHVFLASGSMMFSSAFTNYLARGKFRDASICNG
jgi:hypothetical protein